MILLCYASEDARAAIEHAARLMRGQRVTVLTVCEPPETIDQPLVRS